jgi:PEGA domain
MMGRLSRTIALIVSITSACAVAPRLAMAQPSPTDDVKNDARDRFDRGLRLFNEGDNAGALAEFKRAYDLIPNPVVLFNIGLVYAAMGKAVEAVEVLDRVVADPGSLSADRLDRARQTRDEQNKRIAQLVVTTDVAATVEVDGVEVTKTPLAQPLRITGGVHVIGAIASGYAPSRKELTIAAGEKTDLHLDLVLMQGRAAHLKITTHLPRADVFVDGKLAAHTPLIQSLTVVPGPHSVEIRRPGYLTARQDLTLGDGATAEVTLEPVEDPSAIATSGGVVSLDISEAHANVTVDGKPRGIYTGSLRLPQGGHLVMIERGGFEPVIREVTIDAGRATTLRLLLEPTPEWRAAYVNRTTRQRTWGWVAAATGLAIVGGGVGFLVWNNGQQNAAQNDAARLHTAEVNSTDPCNFKAGVNISQCNQQISQDNANASADGNRAYVGYVGVAIGAAAALFGGYLLLSNDDPHRYDPKEHADAPRSTVVPFGWRDAGGGGGLGLRGTF